MPAEAGWDALAQWACFNDDCRYFREGWDWMMSQYRAKVSYRYRLTDLQSGQDSPLAVWSETALRDRIIVAAPGDATSEDHVEPATSPRGE